MPGENNLVFCYNRGCGKDFDPATNSDGDCRYHPGLPFFHDAYKGWSCCQKKCIDFTEFLNFPGCTYAKHSNEKPPELPKPVNENSPEDIIEVKPAVVCTLKRPPLNTAMTTVHPEVSPSLKMKDNVVENEQNKNEIIDKDNISIGTSCKNAGCKRTYEGSESNLNKCVYHPGCPIFHEGLKFWSCCQKRTSDFDAFLNQIGCEIGNHLWISKENTEDIKCRWDWHQTGNSVVLTVYAKQYSVEKSVIELNPIRVYINLIFPQMNNAAFNLDLELCGIIDVSESKAYMFGTKIEIKLRKAEIGTWSRLNVPIKEITANSSKVQEVQDLTPKVDAVDAVDLSDL